MVIQWPWLFRKILPKWGGFMILGIIFLDDKNNKKRINHEMIHVHQMLDTFIIPFYIWYLIELITKGYRQIIFEREAYQRQSFEDYLENRKPWDFMKFKQ
ncbi:MAG: hypothetical protein CL596_04995 [Alteromonas sp.]|nr:hypothetical protein [Alteromonas sp.]|tara:strand:- start:5606 stop:5905 length:300 start_codon:yes stop_codon:yes gene_type:complete